MTFLYLNKDTMGIGDHELGRKLLISYLRYLAVSDTKIDMIGCVNSGINLTTEDGEALDLLKVLESKGTRITSCGTCLDYHKKREQLRIGVVGTMSQTVDIMGKADKIIQL
ncbi:MAG: sulfurtransferase-like selenium metabolism protein YedF [bacterium]|nr:MAG: sulfurtransferase-like selenium metabolism protein YedF [bacterium]